MVMWNACYYEETRERKLRELIKFWMNYLQDCSYDLSIYGSQVSHSIERAPKLGTRGISRPSAEMLKSLEPSWQSSVLVNYK